MLGCPPRSRIESLCQTRSGNSLSLFGTPSRVLVERATGISPSVDMCSSRPSGPILHFTLVIRFNGHIVHEAKHLRLPDPQGRTEGTRTSGLSHLVVNMTAVCSGFRMCSVWTSRCLTTASNGMTLATSALLATTMRL